MRSGPSPRLRHRLVQVIVGLCPASAAQSKAPLEIRAILAEPHDQRIEVEIAILAAGAAETVQAVSQPAKVAKGFDRDASIHGPMMREALSDHQSAG